MSRISAGLMMVRRHQGQIQVLLAHPGGPYFQHKDDGVWTIPKGEVEPDEDLLVTAQREFQEETGIKPVGPFLPLESIRQKGGKIVHAWAFSGNCDPSRIVSNQFSMEWPPHSGRHQEFPEIDRAEFFDLESARIKIKAGQDAFLDTVSRLIEEQVLVV